MRRLFRQFSAPGGIPSHVSVTTPGSIHEGGELGYVLVHAFGAVMDNPDLLALAVVGDGEAETGPLEGSWKGISFLNPERDGAVLPILHLNGAKIAGPTVLGRKDPAEVRCAARGPRLRRARGRGRRPARHAPPLRRGARARPGRRSARSSRRRAPATGTAPRPRWPMIVLRTPKGWTGPARGRRRHRSTGTWRSHQVPLSGVRTTRSTWRLLEPWLRSYRPGGALRRRRRADRARRSANPEGDLRMSATPHANGGLLTRRPRPARLPRLRRRRAAAGAMQARVDPRARRDAARHLPRQPDDVPALLPGRDQQQPARRGLRGLRPGVRWSGSPDDDVKLSHDGRVMEVLSEHNCHGWLEGYTLTGRHGMFATYEAFAMVSASQTVQHASGSRRRTHLPWRAKVPSLNVLLTSTAWRNDHNGFSHQGPGLIQVVLTQRGDVARIYLPPDANCLLSVADHCLRSRSYVNLIVIDKQPQLQWLTMDEADRALRGRRRASGTGPATTTAARDPDVVLACAGDVVTMETVAAAQILRERLPQLRVRVVNVVDLMTLSAPAGPPARHGRRRSSASCSPTTSTSSSPSTASRARSTSSSTGGPTPTASTSAGSSSRARRRRRST